MHVLGMVGVGNIRAMFMSLKWARAMASIWPAWLTKLVSNIA